MSENHYHTVILGSGEAAKLLSWTLSSPPHNLRTAVIESADKYGGSCPTIACMPSKNFVYSAEIAHLAKKYASTGLLKGQYDGVNMAAVLQRKTEMVQGLVTDFRGISDKSGAKIIMGHGRLLGDAKVEIELREGGKKVLTADNIVICTGSRAKLDDTPGLQEAKPLTHVGLLELNKVPKHLIILGGGYVGLEFAQAFRRFGAKVSVIERNERVLKHEDDDVADALVDILKSEGVEFHTSTSISKISGTSGTKVTLAGTQSGKQWEISGSDILVASGRVPNTSDAGLSAAGVELTSTGFVKVNEYLETSALKVFATGDCAGTPMFTHMGWDDFRVVLDVLLDKQPRRTTKGRQVPYTLYTNPELAHIGLSEKAAQKAGVKYRLSKLPMAHFLRTRAMDSIEGFAKVLVSAEDDMILGFTALGTNAGELLPVVQLAMAHGLPHTSISGLIVTHPTVNEGLVELFGSVPDQS